MLLPSGDKYDISPMGFDLGIYDDYVQDCYVYLRLDSCVICLVMSGLVLLFDRVFSWSSIINFS